MSVELWRLFVQSHVHVLLVMVDLTCMYFFLRVKVRNSCTLGTHGQGTLAEKSQHCSYYHMCSSQASLACRTEPNPP